MLKKLTLGMLVLSALALCSSRAQAQVDRGDMRLSLDTRLIGFLADTKEADDDGVGDLKERRFDFGFASPELGVGFGYTVIDGLVIGGRLGFAFSSTKADPDGDDNNTKTREFGIRIMPYLEYAFNLGKVAPFVTATLGFRNELVNTIGYETEGDPYEKEVTNAFVFAGGGGAHFFLVDAFSIDLTGLIGGEAGGYTIKRDIGIGGANEDDYGYRAFAFTVLAGISGWL